MKWLKKDSEKDTEHFAFEEEPSEEIPEDSSEELQDVFSEESSEEFLEELSEELQEESPEEPEVEAEPQTYQRRRKPQQEDEPEPIKEKGVVTKIGRSREFTWLRGNWKLIVILLFIFGIGLFARAYYGVGAATEDGFLLSGGSDSYYHNYVIDYALDTGDHHFWDNMLNYPVGTRNPRPPLYDWSVSLGGIAFTPFFDGDIESSTLYVLLFSTAFWGALTIFPVYFLAKEAFGKKTGIIAAFLLAIMPGHIQRSVLSNADHDAMALFFIVTAFFFFLKALKILEQREWITNWQSPSKIWGGLKELVSSNRRSLLYAVLGGLSLASVSLIWKGYAYAIVILTVYLFIQIMINRFRNKDSLAVLIVYVTTTGIGLLIAFPYYYQSIQIGSWFDAPLLMFLGVSIFSLILIATNRYPWILVFSSMVLIGVVTVFLLYFIAPSLLDTIYSSLMSGAGYFVSNKQYQTIAEAQAPPFSNLALSFGMITFWLSFVGVAWVAIQLPKNLKAVFIFILLWTGTSIYMAVTAARFMFNAAPAFAITSGWIVALLIDKLDIHKFSDQQKRLTMPRLTREFRLGILGAAVLLVIITTGLATMSELALAVLVVGITAISCTLIMNLIAETNPKKMYYLIAVMVPIGCALFYLYAALATDWVLTTSTHGFLLFTMILVYSVLYLTIRRTKLSFIAGVFFLAFFVVTPNVWAGLDAGIPFEIKQGFDKQIYEAMPVFLQPETYDAENGTNWYLGGFGYSLPLNSRYWPATYDWLATQDNETYPPSDRPAFLSWWDYGFEAVNEGKHPTVADNFLGGHQLAGNFIMAQSEEDAIGLLCARVLEGNWILQDPYGLNDSVKGIVGQYGIDTAKLDDILANPAKYIDEIKANPDIYGPRDDVIQPANAKYLATRGLITEALDKEEVVSLYNDLCEATGSSIRYFAIDSRMFPYSADSTGIFYAPAKLSDHRIAEMGNQPYDFWEIKVVDEFGGEYSLDDVPDDVTINQDNPYKLVYHEMFYNSMLYRTFIGYSGKDVGRAEDAGIPGLSGEMQQDPIMPGWNMTHFKLVHRTAYWNPYPAEEIRDHTDAWQAMNYGEAYAHQEAGEGVSDLSDRSSLYQGVMMLKYYDGAIVSGRVTLEDGTPVNGARITVSDEFGIPHHTVFSDPDGKYSAIAPFGGTTITVSAGAINPMTLMGAELNITRIFIEDYQAMREDEDRDSDGKPDYLIELNPIISSGGLSGSVYWDLDENNEMGGGEVTIPNAELILKNKVLNMSTTGMTNDSGMFYLENVAPGEYTVDVYLAGRSLGTKVATVTSAAHNEQDFGITPTTMTGNVTFEDWTPANGATVTAWIPGEGVIVDTITDENGTYLFDTMFMGNYNIKAKLDTYSSPTVMIEVSEEGNNNMTLIIYESTTISGTVTRKNGSPVPTTSIRFTGTIDYLAMTDTDGSYSIDLANGKYGMFCEYSVGTKSYVAASGLEVWGGDDVFDIVLDAGSKVFGHVMLEDSSDGENVEVSFEDESTGSRLLTQTNNFGDFTITMPQSRYLVQTFTTHDSEEWTYYSYIDFLTDQAELELTMSKATFVEGSVYWDVSSDSTVGSSSREGLDAVTVSFKDMTTGGSSSLKVDTDANGHFEVRLHPGTNYQVTFSKPGFSNVNLGIMNTRTLAAAEMEQTMEPLLVHLSGMVYMNENPLVDQTLMIHFTGSTAGTVSRSIQINRDGNYSVDLMPGAYTVSFAHSVTPGDDTRVLQIVEDVEFYTGYNLGSPVILDLEARDRLRIQLAIIGPEPMDANVTFRDGPEKRTFTTDNGTGTFYVMAGDYVVSASHADNQTIFVGMESFTVSPTSRDINVNLTEGFSIHGLLAYEGRKMPNQQIIFKELSTNGTIPVYSDSDAEYEVILAPDRDYLILVDFVAFDDEEAGAYRFHVNESLTVNDFTPKAHPISLDREDYYVNVSGKVTHVDLAVAPYSKLLFSTHDDVYEVEADEFGDYSINLIPGNYYVYVHQEETHYAQLINTHIGIDQMNEVNFTLFQGYKLSGTTYYDLNKHQITTLTFTSFRGKTSVISEASGFYEIWLPPDVYNVTGESLTFKSGFFITYELDTTISLSGDKSINLPMTMIEGPGVMLSWDIGEKREVEMGSQVTYKISVINTGNVLDTYRFTVAGADPGWTFSFDPPELTINPGEDANIKFTWLTIKTPDDARSDHGPLTVSAGSSRSTETGSVSVIVDIVQEHAIEIEESVDPPSFDKGIISWKFNAKNTGNAKDIFTLYIANQESLRSSGWSAEFGPIESGVLLDNNTRIQNMIVEASAAATVPIVITPIVDAPSKIANVLIVGYAREAKTVSSSCYLTMRYPELQMYSTNLTISGEGITEIPSGDQAANAGVMIVTVAGALILFYVARKRRWIR